MCPRGGSKGGVRTSQILRRTSQNVTDINVRNKATQKTTTWHTVCPRFRRKATQWKIPTGSFLLPKWGKSESHRRKRKEKRIATLPSREDKDIIDLLSRQRIAGSNQTDILQTKFAPAIPNGGEVGNGHTNGRSQVLVFIAMSTHDLF